MQKNVVLRVLAMLAIEMFSSNYAPDNSPSLPIWRYSCGSDGVYFEEVVA